MLLEDEPADGSSHSGRHDRWIGAALSGGVGVVMVVILAGEAPLALPISVLFLVPALTLAVGPTVVAGRLVFCSLFLPRAWRLSRITDLEVRPYLALQGTTYGVRVERTRRVGRSAAFIASTYSGSYGLVERRMLRLHRLLRDRGAIAENGSGADASVPTGARRGRSA